MAAKKKLSCRFVALVLYMGMSTVATAANRYWIGANNDWDGTAANWSTSATPPHTTFDEPDADDVAVFNSSHSVDLAIASQTIFGLTMSGGISLNTNGNDLVVDGVVELSDTSTDLIVDTNSLLTADWITINSDADINLRGGAITVIEEAGTGVLDVNDGGGLSGNGTITFSDAVSAGTQVFNLDGTLTATSTSFTDLTGAAAATLTINVSDADGVIDLDGNDGVSTINVNRNDTLVLNGGVLDTGYSGTINLGSGGTFSRNVAWSLNGTLNTVPGSTVGGFSATATIAGAEFTQTGGSINVDAGETLRISAVFHADDGVIANNGLIIFDNAATIDNASQFQTGAQGSIEVNAAMDIFDQGWDWDGDGGTDNRITINDAGSLFVTNQADNTFEGAIYLNGGTLNAFNSWAQSGGLIEVGGNTESCFCIVGVGLAFSKTGGLFDINPNGSMKMLTTSVWSGGTLNVDGELSLHNTATWSGGITITGNGAIYVDGTSVVAANTTINVHTFDWDGFTIFQNNVHTINNGVALTLNIVNFDADNLDNDMGDAINLGGNGARLEINGPAQWIMDNTLTANTAGASTASIDGNSRMVLAGILNVNGDTGISAGITFDGGSTTFVQAGTTLELEGDNALENGAIYDGGLITGAGTFIPTGGFGADPVTNFVRSSSTISTSTFNFGWGGWEIDPGATLTVDVGDYKTGPLANFFSESIIINSGTVNVNTGDAEFVIAGAGGQIDLNNTTGAPAVWTGEPLSIGADAGLSLVNVGGTGISRINSIVTFRSDAEMNIATGATLVLGNTASFMSVNGANNADFTGAGTLVTNSSANFLEATTLNMVGGTVDFDGENSDTTGNIITVDGPLIINAATFESFGVLKMPGPGDRIDVNSVVGTGSLAVNLTNPNAEWTLDAAGMLRIFNDNTNEVLLSGSDVNINGEFRVTGEVQSNARLDIGIPGVITIVTAGEPFHLNGGNNTDDPNTIVGGSIFGPGILAASDGHALVGFGALNANVDFDGAAHLLVKDGTLYVSSTILDVGTLGTVNSTGTLYMLNPWNTNVADLVRLNGGEITAGAITNDGAAGINGFGLISARVINNTRIDAENGPLLIETFTNDNDWDGAGGTGTLNAISGDLEIHDNESFPFTGTVTASAGRSVFARGFELEFQPGSTLSLADGARYRSTNSTHLGGAVMVTSGTASLEIGATTIFESGGTVVLTGDLRLENPVTVVEAGVSFSGGGALNNTAGRTLRLSDGANVSVLIENQGTLALGASAGQVQGLDFQQDVSGALEIELAGISLDSFDRLALTGQALLGGALNVSLLDGFNPTLGNSFTFLSAAGGITGAFDTISLPILAAGHAWSINDTPTFIQLIVTQAPPLGDYNSDGAVDAADYVVWRKNDGTQAGYDTWRAHFGQTAGNGAALPSAEPLSAVPEPASAVLMMAGAIGCAFCKSVRTRRKLDGVS